MPTELFYVINFSFNITISSIAIVFSFLIIFVIINHRQCHSFTNLLVCDLCVTSMIYSILHIIGCFYGLREGWDVHQPFCTMRAYLLLVMITAASYSFMIQAISRLFFVIFYTHRFLRTWRVHWILIILKWCISFSFSIKPFFVQGGFTLIPEYRMCGVTNRILPVAVYINVISFAFPGSIIGIVYSIILYQLYKSTHRVMPVVNEGSVPGRIPLPSIGRELKTMKIILILLSILACGGIPYLIVTFWNIVQHQSAPQEFVFFKR